MLSTPKFKWHHYSAWKSEDFSYFKTIRTINFNRMLKTPHALSSKRLSFKKPIELFLTLHKIESDKPIGCAIYHHLDGTFTKGWLHIFLDEEVYREINEPLNPIAVLITGVFISFMPDMLFLANFDKIAKNDLYHNIFAAKQVSVPNSLEKAAVFKTESPPLIQQELYELSRMSWENAAISKFAYERLNYLAVRKKTASKTEATFK
jgi:hypothetical protein